MSELLTHEEYKAIADGLTLASTAFVDGGFRKAASGRTFDSIDPATGRQLARGADWGEADVGLPVGKGREPSAEGRWRCLHPH